MDTDTWGQQTYNGHADHEEAPVPTGERVGASPRLKVKRERKPATPSALDDPFVRECLAVLAQCECDRLAPARDGDDPISKANASLVTDRLTAAITELRS